MPTPLADPSALVLFADDRYWPNLQGLLLWAGSLRRVFIYHTETTSDAAQRLQAFCEDFLRGQRPELAVHTLAQPRGILPQEVREQLDAWRREFPGESWLVVDNSASALALAGLLPFASQPDAGLVCRDANAQWFRLLPGDAGGVMAESLTMPAGVTDGVPVLTLLRHFWPEKPIILDSGQVDVADLIRRSLNHRGDWDRVGREAGLPDDGLPFESFLAQALRDLGAANSVILASSAPAHGASERDTMIVINRGGLRIVDGNMNRLEGLANHLRRLVQGLEARALFLWPTRAFPDEFRGLAAAHRLELLERNDVGRFFGRLAAFAGAGALPPGLTEAEKLMEDVANKGLRFFPSRRPRAPERPPRPVPRQRLPRQPRQMPPAAKPAPRPFTAGPVPQPPPQPQGPREAAFDLPVRVKILGPFHLGNLRGFNVQEEGWPVGVLAWGTPGQKPRFGEVVTVYRENLDPKNPRYRWDPKP